MSVVKRKSTRRFMTITSAAREVGIAEVLIRKWILHGILGSYANPHPGNPEALVDKNELLALLSATQPPEDQADDVQGGGEHG
jgi:hypothetical protein